MRTQNELYKAELQGQGKRGSLVQEEGNSSGNGSHFLSERGRLNLLLSVREIQSEYGEFKSKILKKWWILTKELTSQKGLWPNPLRYVCYKISKIQDSLSRRSILYQVEQDASKYLSQDLYKQQAYQALARNSIQSSVQSPNSMEKLEEPEQSFLGLNLQQTPSENYDLLQMTPVTDYRQKTNRLVKRRCSL